MDYKLYKLKLLESKLENEVLVLKDEIKLLESKLNGEISLIKNNISYIKSKNTFFRKKAFGIGILITSILFTIISEIFISNCK